MAGLTRNSDNRASSSLFLISGYLVWTLTAVAPASAEVRQSRAETALTPCGLVSIVVSEVPTDSQTNVAQPLFGPLPYEILLGSSPGLPLRAWIGDLSAPILRATVTGGKQRVELQVPCEVTPAGEVPVRISTGPAQQQWTEKVQTANPAILTTMMADGVVRAVATRPDGTFVSASNPARRGEIIRAFATGLGLTIPAVGTNSIPASGIDSMVQATVIIGITDSAGQAAGVRVTGARAAPGTIGVFEVPFQLPSDAAQGNNVTLSIGVIPAGEAAIYYGSTTRIPVQ